LLSMSRQQAGTGKQYQETAETHQGAWRSWWKNSEGRLHVWVSWKGRVQALKMAVCTTKPPGEHRRNKPKSKTPCFQSGRKWMFPYVT
jgi:hypothetical protein